jgi:ribosomal protein L40E
MSNNPKGNKRMRLGDDGELEEISESSSAEAHVLYCNKCGASNNAGASFCRRCGHSLIDQEAEMMGVPDGKVGGEKQKGKEKQKSQKAHEAAEGETALQVTTIVALGAATIVAFAAEQPIALVPLTITWVALEAIRNSLPKAITDEDIPNHIVTAIGMAAGIIAAVASDTIAVAAVIPLGLGWVILEAIRRSLGSVSSESQPVHVMTTLFFSIFNFIAIASDQAAATVLIMILWVVIEAVRRATQRR